MSVSMQDLMSKFKVSKGTPSRPCEIKKTYYSLKILMDHCDPNTINQITFEYFTKLINSNRTENDKKKVYVNIEQLNNLINGKFLNQDKPLRNVISRVKTALKNFLIDNDSPASTKRPDSEDTGFKMPSPIAKKQKVSTPSISSLLSDTESSTLTSKEYHLKMARMITIDKSLFKNLFYNTSQDFPPETFERLKQVYDDENAQPTVQIDCDDFLALCDKQIGRNYTQMAGVRTNIKLAKTISDSYK